MPVELIHPMLLHFPIVLTYLMVAVDAFALWRAIPLDGRATYANFSLVLAIAAAGSAILAATAGGFAFDVAISRGVPESLMDTHQGLGTTTAIVLTVWAIARVWAWRSKMALAGNRTLILVLAELAFVLLITTTAFYGGSLVYDHGVNVAVAATQ